MTIAAAVTMENIVLGREGSLYRFPAANFHCETVLLDYHYFPVANFEIGKGVDSIYLEI